MPGGTTMSKSMAARTGSAEAPPARAIPPAIRLVLAFKEATESSRPARDPAEEAFEVESLLIAADASFAALSRFADLWHAEIYGESPSQGAGEEQVVLDGYDDWVDAAVLVLDRLAVLAKSGYESAWEGRFEKQFQRARREQGDALRRHQSERGALRAEQLSALAARLSPRQPSYD